jgi:hypothetical protein
MTKLTKWTLDTMRKAFPNISDMQMLWLWWGDGIILGLFVGWLIFVY